MEIAFCYESVLPRRGGCETYIASLVRRLAVDGHQIHLYASRWDASALPSSLNFHQVNIPWCPRFMRPWAFGSACIKALKGKDHDVSIGFDKTWGLDVLYPQGGLFAATAEHNYLKYSSPTTRALVKFFKTFDLSHQSFLMLERLQYLGMKKSLVIGISEMVRDHFQKYYQISANDLRLVRIAMDPNRFQETDRLKRRIEWRQQWNIDPSDCLALFVGMNYRLKGLEPLLHAMKLLPKNSPIKLMIVGNKHTGGFEKMADKLDVLDKVRFVGFCDDMRNCYFASDFLVHPTFYDPCSNVVPEAMGCGLPVITTRYNGASEFITQNKEGIVIDDPHDHEKLAWSMTQYVDNQTRILAGQAARKTAGQWTFEHHYKQMMAVFHEVAARKAKERETQASSSAST
ncbi:MAG: glycosyltransferase family 4 protein [Gemmataceae bacterium]